MNAKEWRMQFEAAANERRITGSPESIVRLNSLLKGIFEDTMDIVERGKYRAENGTVVTLPDWKEMTEKSVMYSKPIELDTVKMPKYKTEVKVESKDCLIAAHNLQIAGMNPIVLNMASPRNPGGGVLRGAAAQEEDLFRRSNLYKSLFQYARYAEDFGVAKSKDQYPLDENYGGVYTPKAVVFRGPKAVGFPLFIAPHILSFVTVAGVCNPRLENGRLAPEEVEKTKNKMRTIFRIALAHGHDSMVLGALGCGAFCNPPDHIASLFHEIMQEPEFKDHFKSIVFAIIEDHNSCRRHNPQGNFIPFQREFAEKR